MRSGKGWRRFRALATSESDNKQNKRQRDEHRRGEMKREEEVVVLFALIGDCLGIVQEEVDVEGFLVERHAIERGLECRHQIGVPFPRQ